MTHLEHIRRMTKRELAALLAEQQAEGIRACVNVWKDQIDQNLGEYTQSMTEKMMEFLDQEYEEAADDRA